MSKYPKIPFLKDIAIFNKAFRKPMNTVPTIPDEKTWQFCIDTIQEELDEMKEAFQDKDIVEVADSLMDILYFVGNTILVTGLSSRTPELWAEVQASNMTKLCSSEEEAKESVKYMEEKKGVPYYYKKRGKNYIVYRKSDNKVGKSVNWREPDLKQYFTEEELKACNSND